MSRAESLLSPSLEDRPIDDALGVHHREMEVACLQIMRAGFANDTRDVALRWRRLEREFLAHMAAEERLLFPAYQRAMRASAKDLRAEHANLRVHVLEIGIGIQLRTIHRDQLLPFLEAVRAHVRHEQDALYPWAQRNLDLSQRHTLLTLIG